MKISEKEQRYVLESSKTVNNSCDISCSGRPEHFFLLTATLGNSGALRPYARTST